MAGALTTTITFADGDQVTSSKLNQIISGTSFTSDAITGTTLIVTGGQLKVGTITASEMGLDSVTGTAIAAEAVAYGNILSSDIASGGNINAGTASKLVSAAGIYASAVIPRAYCNVSISSTARTVGNAFRVASATKLSTTKTRVTFSETQSDAGYCVFGMVASTDGSGTASLVVSNLTTTTFDITHPAEGAPYVQLHLIVFNL